MISLSVQRMIRSIIGKRSIRACCPLVRCFSYQRHIGQPIFQTHRHLIEDDDLTPGFSLKEYEDRQLFLLSRLPVGSTVVVASSSQKFQSWSIPYPYKQNSSFHYLCGIDQPGLLLVLQKLQRNEVRRCLFMKSKSDSKIGQVTPCLFPEDAKQYFGMTEVYDVSQIPSVLPVLLGESKSIYSSTSPDYSLDTAFRSSISAKSDLSVNSLLPELDKIRWIKSLNEQKQLRYSASICTNAFNEMASLPLIGVENRLSAAFEYNVKLRGAEGVSFPTVIAGGCNSQYVQYACNDCIINPGDVLSAGGFRSRTS